MVRSNCTPGKCRVIIIIKKGEKNMANIVSELYYFYGNKNQLEKLYDLISDDDFYMDYVTVTQYYGVDTNNNTFTIVVESNWTSAYHDIENLLAENEIDLSFFFASREEGGMWCFKNDINSQYIKEDYKVYYYPDDEDETFKILNEKKFFTGTELVEILNSVFGKEESMEYYLDYLDDDRFYIYELKKLSIDDKNNNFCTYSEELLEYLSEPQVDFFVDFHSAVYTYAWLSDNNRGTCYSNVGDTFSFSYVEHPITTEFNWYAMGANENEVFSLEKIGEAYKGEYGDDFREVLPCLMEDEGKFDSPEDAAKYYFSKALEQYEIQKDKAYKGKDAAGKAAYHLGLLYGEDEEYESTFNFMHKSVELNCNDAYTPLAMMYVDGLGVEQDIDKAISILKEYTDNTMAWEDEGYAAGALGRLLMETGKEEEGLEYIKIAAAAGDEESQTWCHDNDVDFESDYDEDYEEDDESDYDEDEE